MDYVIIVGHDGSRIKRTLKDYLGRLVLSIPLERADMGIRKRIVWDGTFTYLYCEDDRP